MLGAAKQCIQTIAYDPPSTKLMDRAEGIYNVDIST